MKIHEIAPFVSEVRIVQLPPSRIIGREMRSGGALGNTAPALWDSVCASGDNAVLEALPRMASRDLFGWTMEYDPGSDTFVYMVCALTPAQTPVSDGFTFRDIPQTECIVGQTLERAALLGFRENYGSQGCG